MYLGWYGQQNSPSWLCSTNGINVIRNELMIEHFNMKMSNNSRRFRGLILLTSPTLRSPFWYFTQYRKVNKRLDHKWRKTSRGLQQHGCVDEIQWKLRDPVGKLGRCSRKGKKTHQGKTTNRIQAHKLSFKKAIKGRDRAFKNNLEKQKMLRKKASQRYETTLKKSVLLQCEWCSVAGCMVAMVTKSIMLVPWWQMKSNQIPEFCDVWRGFQSCVI